MTTPDPSPVAAVVRRVVEEQTTAICRSIWPCEDPRTEIPKQWRKVFDALLVPTAPFAAVIEAALRIEIAMVSNAAPVNLAYALSVVDDVTIKSDLLLNLVKALAALAGTGDVEAEVKHES